MQGIEMRHLIFALGIAASFAPVQRADALICLPLTACTCTVNATDMAFGNVQPISGAPADAVSDVQVSCTGIADVLPVVTASVNGGVNGTIADRQMKSGANILHYNLYDSASHSTIVGQGAGGFPVLTISGGVVTIGAWSRTANLYGRIPSTPTAKPGSYTDTITVVLTY
jgi:spore coat protein U-like protein